MILPRPTAPPIHCTPLCRVSTTAYKSRVSRESRVSRVSSAEYPE